MTFQISLSGIEASSQELDVIANNISNSQTTGFKSSNVNFTDVYATGSLNLNSGQTGEGVTIGAIQQQFTQGNIEQTGSNLDLAISGQGFFTVKDPTGYFYTRNGSFSVDNQGLLVNSDNQQVQVYPLLPNGAINTGALAPLQINNISSQPNATTTVNTSANLPANATVPADATFSPTDPSSYTNTTSTTVYDSLGDAHTLSFFYIATTTPNQWNVVATIDGNAVGGTTTTPYPENTIDFSQSGTITSATQSITLPAYQPLNASGAATSLPLNLTLNLAGTTQYGTSFGVNTITQDGYTTGQLTTISVDATGIVSANYTNGRSVTLGQLALASFPDSQGLAPVGKNDWAETATSGNAIYGTAGSANLGNVQSGALESSNVDVTQQLVDMITSQRAFQANAQMITTQDQITQTILQIQS